MKAKRHAKASMGDAKLKGVGAMKEAVKDAKASMKLSKKSPW